MAKEWGGEFYYSDNGTPLCDMTGSPFTRSSRDRSLYRRAIAAIAFGKQAVVVDGNIERLFSRYFGIETPLPAAKTEIMWLINHYCLWAAHLIFRKL